MFLRIAFIAGVLGALTSCVSTGALVAKKEVPPKALSKYDVACVKVTAEKAYDVEVANLLAASLERMRDKQAFKTVAACTEKANPKALEIAMHIQKLSDGNAFLAGMGWGGHAELNFDTKFSSAGQVVGEFIGTANSQQKFTWAGNRWGNLRQKALANAAAEVTVFITKNKEGEKY